MDLALPKRPVALRLIGGEKHYHEVIAPVLAVVGERARPHHRRAMELLASLLPDAELAVVAGAGHAGPNTHPDAIARLVADASSGPTRRHP